MTDSRSNQINIARDHAPIYAVQHGNLTVNQRIGTHLIDELPAGAVLPPGDEQPSRLLNAGNRVVTFTGRDDEIADLGAWAGSPDAVAVRLVHGGAGQGKTRLADRFAELCRAGGWIALRARHSRDAAIRPVETSGGNEVALAGRVLLLVDYAERWPLSDLLALLLDKRLHGSPALRVLLLARPLGNWWDALKFRLYREIGIEADSVELAELGATPVGSREAFEVARDCFARVFGVADSGHPVPEIEGSVLTIHMAALAHVLAVRHGDTPPSDPAHLSAYLLSRERSHWQAMYDNDRRIESRPPVLGQAVFVAALTRALDFPAAVMALRSTGVADGAAAANRVLKDHAMCYPSHDPELRLEPLYPDRLAEDYVALQTPGHGISGYEPDPWAGGALRTLSTADPRSVSTALPLLIEAARRWPHLIERHLVPLLREQPELAFRAGSVALSAIAAAPTMPLDVLASIEARLPADPPDDLYAGIAAVTERLAKDLAGNAIDPVRSARVLQKLGWRLFSAGRTDEGIAMMTEAVAAVRRLPVGDRGAQLEYALRTIGRAHIRVRDWPQAASALSEAVGLWGRNDLGAALPRDEVASCLADLSLALWHIGEETSALEVRQRAIAELRRLIAVHPGHRLTLIRTLFQQAEQLRAEHGSAALTALDDALTLLQAVAGNPDAGADLAATFLGRARTLQSLGRLTDAERAVGNAVRAFRRLSALNIAYDQDLAWALITEAEILGAQHRWRAAVGAQESAIAIHRRLARINADRYGLDLVRGLLGFAEICRNSAQRLQDGLDALTEAIASLQAGRSEPTARHRLLANARALAGDLLDAMGRHEDADRLREPSQGDPPASPAPSAPASRRPTPTLTEADRKLGADMAELAPYLARMRFEHYRPSAIAAALVTMQPRMAWLELMFGGFDHHIGPEVLQNLVRYEELARSPVLLRFTARSLWSYPARRLADVLNQSALTNATAILNFNASAPKARQALRLMDPSLASQVSRLLSYEEGGDEE